MLQSGGLAGDSQFRFDSASIAPADAAASDTVTIPDAHLLFHAEFKRVGSDLKLIGENGDTFVVHDYFKAEKRATLLSPDGAALTPDVVEALAGPLAPGQYAQAGAPQAAAQAIGRVVKVEGNATVVRNGVAITLNAGDAILKGDVAQTGGNSALSLVFTDGTTFALTANARMVLNDFVYSAGGSNNSALINLVQGSITFLAGQVAKTGDMKVETPVATMGIRGTLVRAEMDLNLGTTKVQVMVEQSGITGSFTLRAKLTPEDIAAGRTEGRLLGTVNQAGIGWVIQPAGPLQVTTQQVQLTAAEMQAAFIAMQNIFNDQQLGQQLLQQNPVDQQQNDPNKTDNINKTDNTNKSQGSSQALQDGTPDNPDTPTTPDGPPVIQVNVTPPNNNQPQDLDNNNPDEPLPPDPTPATPVNQAPLFQLQHDPITRVAIEGEHSYGPRLSDNGRYLVFIASDTLPQQNVDGDPSARVYIYDRDLATLRSMTDHLVGSTLHEGESFQSLPSISADGHWVVFNGDYQTIGQIGEGEQTYLTSEVFLYDSQTDTATRIADDAWNGVISANGEFVAFEQFVPNQEGPGGHNVIRVMDLTDPGHPIVASIEHPGHKIGLPGISGGGRYISFISDEDGFAQVYLFDLDHPELGPKLISHTSDGEAGNGNSGALSFSAGENNDNDNWVSGLSGDGRYVVFQSNASDLVANDHNGHSDIFLYDRDTDTVTLVSRNAGHTGSGDGASFRPEISLDGRYIAFVSNASDLDGGDNGQPDVFVYDRETRYITLVSAGTSFTASNGDNEWGVSVTSGGVFVAFGSEASNLVDNDGNGLADIFVLEHPNVVDHPAATELTTDGTLAFTDTSDTHTVTSEADPEHDAPWGALTDVHISNDTTGDNTDGRIAWSYQVDRSDAVAQLGAGETHVDYFKVFLTDGGSNTIEKTLAITIVGVNDAPEGNPEDLQSDIFAAAMAAGDQPLDGQDWLYGGPTYYDFREDAVTSIPVSVLLANDSDVDDDALAIARASAQHGTVALIDGNVVYVPDADFHGADSLTYVISDGHGGLAEVTDAFTVAPVNDDPVFSSGFGGVAYMTGSGDPWGVGPGNAGSPDAAMDTAFGSGNWTKLQGFTTAALNGDFQFLYIDGGDGVSSEFNTFIGNNTGALQTFVASGGHLFVNAARWDQPALNLGFGATMVLSFSAGGHAVDPEHPIFIGPNGDAGSSWSGNWFAHDAITGAGLTSLITGDHGETLLAAEQWGAGLVLFGGITSPYFQSPQPQADILRANILSYGAGGTGGGAAKVTEDLSGQSVESAGGVLSFTDVDTNDTHAVSIAFKSTDHPGGQLGAFALGDISDTVNGVGGAIPWTFSVANGAIQFLGAGETIHETYTVTLTDNHGGTATRDITVTIDGSNDAPVASAVTLTDGTEDTPYTIQASTLLSGVTDVDGPGLSITSLSVASGGGSVVDNHDGTFTYTPAADYNGPVSFDYTASDGSLTSSATASLNLAAVNDAPNAAGDANAITAGGEPISGNVLANDSDPDSDTLTVSAVTLGAVLPDTFVVDGTYGELVVTKATGAYTYTLGVTQDQAAAVAALAGGTQQDDRFTYTADDGHGGAANADLAITLTGVNDAPAIETGPTISRVSVPASIPPGGSPNSIHAIAPDVSDDGRYVVFFSTDILPGAGGQNGDPHGDVFLYDRIADTTAILTDAQHIALDSREPGEAFQGFSISSDGRFVVFQGQYQVTDDFGTHNESRNYIYDRNNDQTRLLTNPVTGSPFDTDGEAHIGGRLIVFASQEFTPFGPPLAHVLVTDVAGNIQADITTAMLGITDPNVHFRSPTVSGGGRYVSFWTETSTPESFQPTGIADLYVFDRSNSTYAQIASTTATEDLWWPTLSNEGRFIVFQSDAALVADDHNGKNDIYVYDREANGGAGGIQRVSVDNNGAEGNGDSIRPNISPDGRYVIFASDAANLVPGDGNASFDTFVYDLQAHTIARISVGAGGIEGNGDSSLAAAISGNGLISVFAGTASNLVPGDNNGASDIFIVDKSGGTTGPVVEDWSVSPGNTLSTLGAFTFSDIDLTDTHSVGVTTVNVTGVPAGIIVPAGGLGTFTPTVVENAADGDPHGQVAWAFTLDNAAIQGLGAGQKITQIYTVQIDDGHGGLATQGVKIVINGTNDNPVVSGVITGDATEDDAPVTLDALVNATDIDSGTTLSVVNVPDVLPAGVSFSTADHTFTLDPSDPAYQSLAAGQQTTVTVNYSISDGNSTTPDSVSWTVTGVNDAPVAIDDSAFATAGAAVDIVVLANDSDAEDDALTVTHVGIPNHGTAVIGPDGVITYAPDAGFSGTDSFSYMVSDDHAAADTGIVSLVVGIANHHTVGGDVFLQGNYMELGISSSGSLGTLNGAPAGYHPAGGRSNISFRVDADGWNTGSPSSGDFTLPGTPVDTIAVGFNGHSYANDERDGVHQIATTTSDISAGGLLSARTIGIAGGALEVTQVITLDPSATFYTTLITLTNVSAATISDVRFMRTFDPDQDLDTHGTYSTFNDVLANPNVSGSIAIASATGAVSGQAVALVSLDPSAHASNFGFANYDPYNPSAYDFPIDRNGAFGDEAISLTFDVDSLAAGQSVARTYYTTMNMSSGANDMRIGTNGAEGLSTGNGDDWLFGLGGNDTLTGGAGDDRFVFTRGNGADIILDFHAGANTGDVIVLDRVPGFNDFAHVLAAATDQSGGVKIDLGGGDSITLSGISASQLHQDDFVLVT